VEREKFVSLAWFRERIEYQRYIKIKNIRFINSEWKVQRLAGSTL